MTRGLFLPRFDHRTGTPPASGGHPGRLREYLRVGAAGRSVFAGLFPLYGISTQGVALAFGNAVPDNPLASVQMPLDKFGDLGVFSNGAGEFLMYALP